MHRVAWFAVLSCDLSEAERATVAAIADGDTLNLSDGRQCA